MKSIIESLQVLKNNALNYREQARSAEREAERQREDGNTFEADRLAKAAEELHVSAQVHDQMVKNLEAEIDGLIASGVYGVYLINAERVLPTTGLGIPYTVRNRRILATSPARALEQFATEFTGDAVTVEKCSESSIEPDDLAMLMMDAESWNPPIAEDAGECVACP